MSRIHEAVRKAATDEESEGRFSAVTATDILSTSSIVAARAANVHRNNPSADSAQVVMADSGEIPTCAHEAWAPQKKGLLFSSDASNPLLREQFRALRTRLNRLRELQGVSVIAVVSPGAGDGKTLVATNLAYALAARRDAKVLLVDADLRKGSATTLAGARAIPGLTEFLGEGKPLPEVLQTDTDGKLYLVASGAMVAEPGELVGNKRFNELIGKCRRIFDWIVVDTPPAVQFSDAHVIAGQCDGLLFVVSASVTPIDLAKRALQGFSGHRVLGAVLNRAESVPSISRYYNEH